MSKANRSARDKVLGGVNWWSYLTSIRPRGFRNTPQYLDYKDIIGRTTEMKKINKMIQNRKKQEKKQLKIAKNMPKLLKKKKIKVDKLAKQIQRGYDLVDNSKRHTVIIVDDKKIIM